MKKEINYLMIYFATVLIAVIIALSVENKSNKVRSTKIIEAVFDKPDVDWTNVENPEKKAYLEHLYNKSE